MTFSSTSPSTHTTIKSLTLSQLKSWKVIAGRFLIDSEPNILPDGESFQHTSLPHCDPVTPSFNFQLNTSSNRKLSTFELASPSLAICNCYTVLSDNERHSSSPKHCSIPPYSEGGCFILD